MFLSFLNMPTDEQWKDWYRKQRREADLDIPADKLKEMNYTDEEIKSIKKEIANRE